MLCEKCGKNNATTHIRTIMDGVVREKNLCGYCAANEGYSNIGHNSLAQMLASMFGDALALDRTSASAHCPCCGATFSDIAEKGKVGCAECYKTFYEELLPYVKSVHGSIKHTGRIPNRAPLTVTPQGDSIESLRMRLNMLVSEEKFEEAAVIRDKIKELEGEK
ncbi:MAG: UvrB/UvrC motif-containing protein [Clostridia bacterium]|nr:UvrB/UvrC motif-containing protein [Clostridia bacterium]